MVDFAHRALNAREKELWDKAQIHLLLCDARLSLTKIELINLTIANSFAKEWFFPPPFLILDLNDGILHDRLSDNCKILKKIFDDVDGNLLFLQFKNNDINIIAAPGTNIEQYTLGFPWVGLAVGVVIVSGIIALIKSLDNESQELQIKLEKQLSESDQLFCQNKSSEVCLAWLEKRRTSDFNDNDDLMTNIKNTIKETSKLLVTGIGAAMAVALGLGIWFLFKSKKK